VLHSRTEEEAVDFGLLCNGLTFEWHSGALRPNGGRKFLLLVGTFGRNSFYAVSDVLRVSVSRSDHVKPNLVKMVTAVCPTFWSRASVHVRSFELTSFRLREGVKLMG
jgi:hypothetical protein